MKTFYLVDGHAQLFRAYYAPFRELTAPDGRPVKAVYVFTQMMLSLLAKQPDYLAVAFDVSDDTTFRKDEFEAYKANREEAPQDLDLQYALVRLVLERMGVQVFEQPGFEADDLIATIATRLPDDVELRIVSKDKDLHQILGERVGLFDPKDGSTLFGPDLLAAKGYTPEQAVEVQTLVGDPTDNIPGVRGIGTKTAAKLIAEHGSAEAVLAAAPGMSPKRRDNLLAATEVLPVTRRLVTLRRDAPVDLDLNDCRPPQLDPGQVRPVFEDLGFRTFAEQVGGAAPAATDGAQGSMFTANDEASTAQVSGDASGTPASAAAQLAANGGVRTVVDENDLDVLIAELQTAEAFAVDTETTGLRPLDAELLGVALAVREGQGWYLPLQAVNEDGEAVRTLPPDTILAALAPFLANEAVTKVGQNLKYDLQVLWNAGLTVRGPLFDTMIAAALLRPERRGNGLDALARDLLGVRMVPISELIGKGRTQIGMDQVPLSSLAAYAAEDAEVTWRLYRLLRQELDDAPPALAALVRDLEFPLVAVLARMEARGIALDVAMLQDSARELEARIEELRSAIQQAAGRDFNVDSPAQLSEVLFDDLKMRVVKRTKTGRSTDASVLETLAVESDHPLPKLVLSYREATKLLSTYVAPLPDYVSPLDGRVHPGFHQVGAATGRLSSSEPNIQNIPVRTETGRSVRRAFTAGGEDRRLLVADYSQVELRILAHLSRDPELTRAFQEGADVHAWVASQVFGVALGAVDREQRRVAKAVNFGIVYGQGAFGLSRTLGIPQKEAAAFIAAYKERYPGIERFLAECVHFAEEHGYVQTMLGRRRPVPEVTSRNRQQRSLGERLAINTVVQGSAADLIKRAMLDLDRRLAAEADLDAHMIVQVHDELLFDVHALRTEAAATLVRDAMSGAMELRVPLVVDLAVARTWGDAKG